MINKFCQQLSEGINECLWNDQRRCSGEANARANARSVSNVKFLEDKEQLGLALNEDGIWECHGRIQGEYPIYLPDTALFTTKIVQRSQLSTLHGGVAMTTAKVRKNYWIPDYANWRRK